MFRFFNEAKDTYRLNITKIEVEFADQMHEWLALQNYMIALSDSKMEGYNICLYRQFHIVLTAALLPVSGTQPLENPLIM